MHNRTVYYRLFLSPNKDAESKMAILQSHYTVIHSEAYRNCFLCVFSHMIEKSRQNKELA